MSSDREQALSLLTTELVTKLIEYRKQRQGIALSISFVGTNIYIALPQGRELFEPSLTRSVVDFSAVEALFKELVFFTELLQEFGLESKN